PDDENADKNDVNETKQDDEDDEEHDDNETDQNDDDEEQTESEDDGDDFIHPKLTTHDDEIIHEEETDKDDTFDPIVHTPSHISSSDEEDSDNEVEGTNVEGAKTQEEATDTEDQGNEEVKDTNTDLDGRDKVMTDVEDTHVTLTPVNPDGQQQSSSVSSGFVSSMLNPNQDTGVDDIFRQHTEATSLIDTNVTAIMEPFFTEQINRPPTPHPIIIQPQQLPILTPATTTSSSLQNLPNFASLFGFDHRLKALEDNFSELRQSNQYAEALSSIPSTVEQYLANKMQEAVDVAVQLKYERIREESSTANQQFLESIDDGMKKIIKEQVKKEVSKIIPKVEKLVTEQLESEVLVRSSKEANTSHAVAANLSELELKKILIDKMEANNSINRSIHSWLLLQGIKETMQTTDVFEAPAHQEFETGVHDEQAEEEVQHLPDWFQQPTRLPSPDHAWNKSVPAVHESVQPWLSNLIIAVTKVEIVEWQNYKHLDWITVRRDDDVLYKFTKRFHRPKDQDIMFTRSVVIQRRVEDLQLGVESYQKKLNLTKPDTYRSNLRRRDAYTPYSDPRGFIYENKDKKNRLMRIDELHKFSDGTLDDVRTALNDRLKGIRNE
ncbi:hypothetical protein Tco_1126599, partial [Tanacetum coccineum]